MSSILNSIQRLLRIRMPISRKQYMFAAMAGFLCFFAVWQGLSNHYASQGKAVLFPSPASTLSAALDYIGYGSRANDAVAEAFKEWQEQPSPNRKKWSAIESEIRSDYAADLEVLLSDIRVSFVRVMSAFLLSVFLALPLGIYLGAFRAFEGFVQPVTEFSRYVPVPALIPLLIVLFGIGEMPKVMLIFIGTFFQLLLMVKDEIRRVPEEQVQAAETMGATRSEILFRVMAPSAMPGIFDAFRMCNGWAWTWLIVAELVAANEGMGFRIIKFQRFLQTDRIFVYLILLGLIGLVLDLLFRMFNKRLFRWANK